MSRYRLELGDAFEVMANIEDGCVDYLCCDLPYGTTQLAWDAAIKLETFWLEAERICKPSAMISHFSAQPFTTDLINSKRDWYRYELIWHKTMPTGFLDANRRPLRAHESILLFAKTMKGATYNPQMTQGQPYKTNRPPNQTKIYGGERASFAANPGTRHPTSLVVAPNTPRDAINETQKPLELLYWLLETYSNPGDLVADFTAGGATAGVAALLTGRKFIGAEIRPDQHAQALRRPQAAAQGQLFEVTP